MFLLCDLLSPHILAMCLGHIIHGTVYLLGNVVRERGGEGERERERERESEGGREGERESERERERGRERGRERRRMGQKEGGERKRDTE